MSLPYFKEFDWEPFVLAVSPDYVEGLTDAELETCVPDGVSVFRTKALPLELTRYVGLGSLGLRALPYLARKGDEIIKDQAIDLVYFSTTIFPVMSLGAVWRRKWGVPYVLDFQDPWLSSYYDAKGAPHPPGGKFKYKLSHSLARLLEPRAMRRVSHVISVSPDYPQVLAQRYPAMREEDFTVLPFGATEEDFKRVFAGKVEQSAFDPGDGLRHLVYVGRGGGDMAKALRILFTAIKHRREREPENINALRLHFVGTDYAPAGRAVKSVEPIAHEVGIADLVVECTSRVPYFEALKILTDSDGILLFGSDDPGYTASKLYPCILARKPILAVFHERSSVVEILRRCNAGRAVTFKTDSTTEDVLGDAGRQLDWLLSLPTGYCPDTDWSEFEPYTAREMTRRQCEVFDRCVS
jgi:glycosyltransferase involved in cell wall biosynthesis